MKRNSVDNSTNSINLDNNKVQREYMQRLYTDVLENFEVISLN